MCFWEREWSSAGQVTSLSQWESTPWNSPREARKAFFIIFFLYYCQNFTFCSWGSFFFYMQSLSFGLCPIWMLNVFCALCSYIYLLILESTKYLKRKQFPVLRYSTWAIPLGLSVTNACIHVKWTTGTRPGPAFQSISACITLILGWKHANGNISWTNMVITLRCLWETGPLYGGGKKPSVGRKNKKHLAAM